MSSSSNYNLRDASQRYIRISRNEDSLEIQYRPNMQTRRIYVSFERNHGIARLFNGPDSTARLNIINRFLALLDDPRKARVRAGVLYLVDPRTKKALPITNDGIVISFSGRQILKYLREHTSSDISF